MKKKYTRQEIEQEVKEAIAKIQDCEVEYVSEGACLNLDLGMDSIDVLDLVMVLEQNYSISITDKETYDMRYKDDGDGWLVKNVFDMVERKIKEKK